MRGRIKIFHFAIFILPLIFISACAGISIGGGAKGGGVVPTLFSFSPAQVMGGQQTYLELNIQNKGSVDATSVNVFLFGMPSDWTGLPTSASQISTLKAASSELGIEGEKKLFSWILTAPTSLPKGQTYSHQAQARVCYKYSTTAIGKVKVMTQNQWLLEQQKGRLDTKAISLTETAGPLSITIKTQQPIVSGTNTILDITINNVGGGYTIDDCSKFSTATGAEGYAGLNKVTLNNQDCSITSGDVYFKRGKTAELSLRCSGLTTTQPEETKDIKLELTYSYYIDTKAGVQVVGTTELGTTTATAGAGTTGAGTTAGAGTAGAGTTAAGTGTTSPTSTPTPTPTSTGVCNAGNRRCSADGKNIDVCFEGDWLVAYEKCATTCDNSVTPVMCK